MSDKREHILNVAEELFAEKGFDGTSVRDIAQQAGVNLAMISYYFGSKEKLLESLIEFRAGYAYGILEELNKDTTLSPWDKVDRLVDFYVDRIIHNMKFHTIMWQESSARSEEIKNRTIGIKLRNLDQITKIIADGQQKKLFRQVDIPMTVGTIMGTKTFGKGVVQTIYPMPDGSAVKITTARYLTPRNRDINHLGISPDVMVVENKHPQYGTPAKDGQLERAIQYLTEKLAKLNQENGV